MSDPDRVSSLLQELAGAQALERLLTEVLGNVTDEQKKKLADVVVGRALTMLKSDNQLEYDLQRSIRTMAEKLASEHPLIKETLASEVDRRVREKLESYVISGVNQVLEAAKRRACEDIVNTMVKNLQGR